MLLIGAMIILLLRANKTLHARECANQAQTKSTPLTMPFMKLQLPDYCMHLYPREYYTVVSALQWRGSVYNIFLTDPSDSSLAELEIMIAEPSYRGKGLGKEVTRMMICYGVTKLGIRKFEAKIGLDNKVSIAMFKRFHFHELSVSEVFREVTLGMTVDQAVRTRLLGDMAFMQEREYRKDRDSRQEVTSSHATL